MKNKVELLAPAGSLEKLKYAIHYGADAVYAGIPDFSMRYRINKFDKKTLKEGINYAHKYGVKFYVTINIYAHNYHLPKIEKHLKYLKTLKPDGIIVSDLGIINLIKKYLPKVDIHISTQANTINWQAVKFWKDQNVKRVILAREATLKDIKEIKKRVPNIELEYFVHGAMCMSYSGRCILSKWMTGRSANLGDCAQPCRWKYQRLVNSGQGTAMTMNVEDARGEYKIDLEEDAQGTYFFNSKDLNLLNYLSELQKAGINSFKIEGRNKSVYYLATVIRSYRRVLDALAKKIPKHKLNKIIKEEQGELDNLMHRGYTAGFLHDEPVHDAGPSVAEGPEHNFHKSHEDSPYEFVGEVVENEKLKVQDEGGRINLIKIIPHNAIYKKDKIEIITKEKNIPVKIRNILDEEMNLVLSAHGGQDKFYYLEIDKQDIAPMSLLRKAL